MSQSPYDDPLLKHYDLRVDPTLRLLFCTECNNAISCSNVRSHVTTHSNTVPPETDFEEVLAALGVTDDFVRPTEPIARIVGLKHTDHGYKCTYDGCGRLLTSKRRVQEHFKNDHDGIDSNQRT